MAEVFQCKLIGILHFRSRELEEQVPRKFCSIKMTKRGLSDAEIVQLLEKPDSDQDEAADDGDGEHQGSDFEELVQTVQGCQIADSDADAVPEVEGYSESAWVEEENEPECFEPEPVHCTFASVDLDEPASYFSIFFTDELLEIIVNETNAYADKCLAEATRPMTRTNRLRYWRPTDIDEMKKLLGLTILMGLNRLPSLTSYWKDSPIYGCTTVRRVMSRNRFEILMRFLHFSSVDAKETGDPLAKIRAILDYLQKKFAQLVCPGKELCIDESMVGWKGRLKFKQYIRNKKHKYGIKIYKLCMPNGYILNFIVYTGKSSASESTETLSKTEAVVMQLLSTFLDSGHEVYMDNFYNSVSLAFKLQARRTHVIGTLRAKRKMNCKAVVNTKLKTGDVIWRRYKSIVLTKWKDKKDVLMISTKHKHAMVPVENKRKQTKLKPLYIVDYNKYMSGVDFSDQMSSYQATPRRTIKWYKKLFFYFLDAAIVNSFIVVQACNREKYKKMKITSYREQIVQSWCKLQDSEATASTPTSSALKRVKKQHYLEPIPCANRKSRSKRCRHCSNNNNDRRRKESTYQCSMCEDKPALCVFPCFKDFHEQT